MSESRSSLEARLSLVEKEVRELAGRMDELVRRLDRVSTSNSLFQPRTRVAAVPEHLYQELPRVSLPTFLSGFATVCFLLVVALLLRTLVDSEIVNQELGMVFGLGYASLLIAVGAAAYARAKSLAPVFACCGAFLTYSIVLETHTRFGLMGTVPAYIILAVVLTVMSVIGLHYGAPSPLSVGTLGAFLTAVFLRFPTPLFPVVTGIGLLAITFSYLSRSLPPCRWLPWAVQIAALFFWFLWSVKVRAPLLHGHTPAPELFTDWVFPAAALAGGWNLLLVILSGLRKKRIDPVFEASLPILNGLWFYFFTRSVLLPLKGTVTVLGSLGLGLAAVHLVLAGLFAGKGGEFRYLANSFAVATVVFLLLATPAAFTDLAVVGLAWSVTGLLLCALSRRWRNREVRFAGHFLQAAACAAVIVSRAFHVQDRIPWGLVGVLLACSILAWIHYRTARGASAPLEKTGFLALVDPMDRVAVVVLGTGSIALFAVFRHLLYGVLPVTEIFQAGQSVLICLYAMILLGVAHSRKNKEILLMAGIVVAVGAGKVFGYDLFTLKGMPLVVAVFVFGLTVAVASFVWNRRERNGSPLEQDGG